MSRSSRARRSVVKGAFFETLIRVLLGKGGFTDLPSDPKNISGDKMRGRGAWHQIDAFGMFSYTIPFLYPIRLLCEAKNYNRNVQLPEVRNFYGAYKDIQEVYYIEKLGQSLELLTKRYTDAAAMFSSTGFSEGAQDYAYAQGIKLISYESNQFFIGLVQLMDICLDELNWGRAASHLNEFKQWISNQMDPSIPSGTMSNFEVGPDFFQAIVALRDSINGFQTSYIATAGGNLPIHILSLSPIPWDLFTDTDRVRCRIYYSRETPNFFRGEIPSVNYQFFFSVPHHILSHYLARMQIENESDVSYSNERSMRDFKRNVLSSIDFFAQHNGIRRILTFESDNDWLNDYNPG